MATLCLIAVTLIADKTSEIILKIDLICPTYNQKSSVR